MCKSQVKYHDTPQIIQQYIDFWTLITKSWYFTQMLIIGEKLICKMT